MPSVLLVSARLFRALALVVCMAALFEHPAAFAADTIVRTDVDNVILLLPDGADTTDPRVTVWLDAAREEGLHLRTLTDSQFVLLGGSANIYSGVILPDQVHLMASDGLVAAIQTYVSNGGNLMLVYDAGLLLPDGFYPTTGPSRFSAMVGTTYADYGACYPNCNNNFIALINATGKLSALRSLRVPPGKSMPLASQTATTTAASMFTLAVKTNSNVNDAGGRSTKQLYVPIRDDLPSGLARRDFDPNPRAHPRQNLPLDSVEGPPLRNASLPADPTDTSSVQGNNTTLRMAGIKAYAAKPLGDGPAPVPDTTEAISGFFYGRLNYPSYTTADTYLGTWLLNGNNTTLTVAGVHQWGGGRVLFVNTPLGYLKGSGTDGLLLHGMLHYFAVEMLGQPYVVALPSGKAGLIANVHVDCGEALGPMQQLKDAGIWSNGPFSVHFTAGPDCVTFGDGLGLNVPGNAVTQSWIRYFDSIGHKLGNHGGWIHDYYGANASETNQADFQQYLDLNNNAMAAVLGKPLIEYSAPEGNTPLWSVTWAEQKGVVGYYTLANSGMAPTRTYRNGQLYNRQIWSMPLTPYQDIATFEDFGDRHIAASVPTAWLKSLVDFSVAHRTSRMVYFHPPGAVDYLSTMLDWMKYAKNYGSRFAWYTMTDLATFMSRRDSVSWQLSKLSSGSLRVDATHPNNLNGITWSLSKARYSRPGNLLRFTLVDDTVNNEWILVGGAGARSASFTTNRL